MGSEMGHFYFILRRRGVRLVGTGRSEPGVGPAFTDVAPSPDGTGKPNDNPLITTAYSPNGFRMATAILGHVHRLSDVELALLLGLATREHPVLTVPAAHLDALTRRLARVVPSTLGLSHAV
ncbi:hypothetical protein E4U42_000514, partial [Claviceps africana]